MVRIVVRVLGGPAGAVVGALLLAALLAPRASEAAWVRDEVRLNLRTGAGTNYRIVGVVKTGDQVTVLHFGDEWIRVRTQDGREGFIPVGFLQADAPAAVKVEALESEVARLSGRLETTSAAESRLRTANAELEQRHAQQTSTVERLTEENRELKAGERWPYLITGAGILALGMVVGAALQALSGGRRSQRRIKL